MEFKQAFEAMKQGAKVRLSTWKGYWAIENDRIMMHCKDGSVIDFQNTDDIFYTMGNVLQDDWEVADLDETIDPSISTMEFPEALRRLKMGERVSRKKWDADVVLQAIRFFDASDTEPTQTLHDHLMNESNSLKNMKPCINMYDIKSDICLEWVPSQEDIFANDWYLVKS